MGIYYVNLNVSKSPSKPNLLRRKPNVPENCKVLPLVQVLSVDWGIYELKSNEDLSSHAEIQAVPGYLRTLVESAMRYPPALALARNRMDRRYNVRIPSRPQFQTAYASCLRMQLRSQHTKRFMMVEAVKGEAGYLARGEFCWALRYDKSTHSVDWVSWDYYIYSNSAGDFRLDISMLQRLSG